MVTRTVGERSHEEVNELLGLGCSKQASSIVERRAFRKLSVYALVRLGRPPRDIYEVVGLFAMGPDPEGVQAAWKRSRCR